MKLSLQITSRNFELTDAIKAEITEKVEKLEDFCDQILKCRVVVESPHWHSNDGRLYNVNIDLKIPGTEIGCQAGAERGPVCCCQGFVQCSEAQARGIS